VDNSIAVVVVTYAADAQNLRRLLLSCSTQGSIIIVNNHIFPLKTKTTPPTILVVEAGKNLGLASGLNIGAKTASQRGFKYVVFFDQDSVPEDSCLKELRCAFEDAEKAGDAPAAVGPLLGKGRSDGACASNHRPAGVFGQDDPTRAQQPYHVSALVGSGLFTSLARFNEIGPFEEGLFIDNVDLEWSFRAQGKGFHCFVAPRAGIKHAIGEVPSQGSLLQNPFSLIEHGPSRQYYMMRNRIHMYKRPYVPLSWKVHDLPRVVFKSAYFSTLVRPRWQNAQAIARGLWDGLTNVYGPIDGRYRRSTLPTNISASAS
jgi:rhamnosyltransferase